MEKPVGSIENDKLAGGNAVEGNSPDGSGALTKNVIAMNAETNVSNRSAEKAFDRAVDLIIHVDTVTSDWTGRLITVQTSLVISEGILLGWKADHPSFLVFSLGALIAVVGLDSLLLLTNIIVREHEYGHHYWLMVKRAEGFEPYSVERYVTRCSGRQIQISLQFPRRDPGCFVDRISCCTGGVVPTLIVAIHQRS